MSWQVLISAAANTWSGFFLGAIFARLCGRSRPDMIAIAIETGIQNTGVSFIILRLALVSPFHDFAMTVPVAASMMSTLPLAIIYFYMKCCSTNGNDRKSESKRIQKINPIDNNQSKNNNTKEQDCFVSQNQIGNTEVQSFAMLPTISDVSKDIFNDV